MTSRFKWYYHDKARNETLKALQCGADHPFLLFVGNPGCAVCAAAWKALDTAAFSKFMEANEIVGLKVDDKTSHYQALASQAKLWRNPDGSKVNEGPPFLALVKTKGIITDDPDVSFSLRKSGATNVEAWICGSTPKYVPAVNAKNVMAWIEQMEKTDVFKAAFPWLCPECGVAAPSEPSTPSEPAQPAPDASVTVPASVRRLTFTVTCDFGDAGPTVTVSNVVAK